ncbi:MAG: 23S rRNA (guanosine(2251)-2'-O)-methyltransferase RlmB [Xanthomonadaceae bacterium]|nr:23S rRNA (guanosine(2251)-2'-O)-methyltransferase RlmB [Xanthomonadaceae bacterium]
MASPTRPVIAGTELVLGINAVNEVIQSGNRAIEVLYCNEHAGNRIAVLEDLAKQHGVLTKRLPKAAMDRMAGYERHQGAILKVSPAVYCLLKELFVPESSDREKLETIIALDGITDPQNLGSILRTAAAAGVSGVIIPERRAAGITPTVARIASGGLEYLKVCRVKNLVNALQEGRRQGFWIAGTVAANELSIYQADLCRQLVVVIGSEDKGIRPLVRKNCDFLINIPLHSALDSLNVAAATAVVLFEIKRQQLLAAG